MLITSAAEMARLENISFLLVLITLAIYIALTTYVPEKIKSKFKIVDKIPKIAIYATSFVLSAMFYRLTASALVFVFQSIK